MTATKDLLRGLREKLRTTAGGLPFRLLALDVSRDALTYRVCVEISRVDGPLVLFFYRHDDGLWHAFPPSCKGCMMSVEPLVA